MVKMNHYYMEIAENRLKMKQIHGQEFSLGQSLENVTERFDQENEANSENGGNELIMAENSELVISSEGKNKGLDLALIQHDIEPVVTPSSHVIQERAFLANADNKLFVGQAFPDSKACRKALRDNAIALHFEMHTIKSDKSRFTAKCVSEGCPWRIHAAKLPGVSTFTIRTIHDYHNCGGIDHLGHKQASAQWVASSVEEKLRENPNYKPKEILEEIYATHGITLSYKQAWRGKERIMASMRGSFEEGYRLLPLYCEQVKRTNPGSIASVYANPTDNCFQRLFIAYQASIYGFLNACQPLLGLDRTLLKSKYLGTLLLAIGIDGDGGVFPLAFGVVDEESDNNWMWFVSELHNLLRSNTENMPRLTILSSRLKGIVDGVNAYFPTAFHGFCMRYLIENFQKEFNNSLLVNLLWDAAHAVTIMQFESKILEIEDISQDAAYWIRRIPPHLWATSYFEGARFGHLTTNMVEWLNTWFTEASGLSITQMMECIRRQLTTLFNERRETSMQWTSILVPTAQIQVAEALDQARTYQDQVSRANEAEFEVISNEGTFIVDIMRRDCNCREWQLYGYPCVHAVAVLLLCRKDVQEFTDSSFTVAMYRKAYSQMIHPIPDNSLWKQMSEGDTDASKAAEIVINPPKSLRPISQPRKKRVRTEDQDRVKRVVHCSRCNQTGHFRTTCVVPI